MNIFVTLLILDVFFDVNMKIVEKLLARFNGLHYRQEYLCLALEDFSEPLNVYAVRKQRVIKNLTAHHLFVGYSPVIMALPFMVDERDRLQLVFCPKVFNENDTLNKKDVLAELFLQKIEERNVDGTDIFF